MKSTLYEEAIYQELSWDVSHRFGFEIISMEPIKRGWLNLKWKINTSGGTYLLKQYNKERLRKYTMQELQDAFQQQNHLASDGIPCPRILSDGNNVFCQSPGGERYVVMEFCDGEIILPGKFSEEQMYGLGYYTGKIHAVLNGGNIDSTLIPAFVPPSKEERTAYWKAVHEEVYQSNKMDVLPIIEKQLELMRVVDFSQLPLHRVGWAHRDLWNDNLLFQGNQLSAILDFDRMKYDHLPLDVARAIISGALDGHSLNMRSVQAFLAGYRVCQVVEERFLTNALTLLWYLESEWWLDANMFERKGPPKRFVHEMVWLSEHLLDLEDILGGK
jgi:homoserine kinase type II